MIYWPQQLDFFNHNCQSRVLRFRLIQYSDNPAIF